MGQHFPEVQDLSLYLPSPSLRARTYFFISLHNRLDKHRGRESL